MLFFYTAYGVSSCVLNVNVKMNRLHSEKKKTPTQENIKCKEISEKKMCSFFFGYSFESIEHFALQSMLKFTATNTSRDHLQLQK